MFRRTIPALFAVALTIATATPSANAAGAEDDARIVAEARRVVGGERIALYADGADPDPAFVEQAERALAQMEAALGRGLDTETLGVPLRVYVSSATTVSHVWRGYSHPQDPQGALFLNPKIVRLGMAGRNATYAHELAHLLTWRFSSHTLREGLADWLALQVHPGAAVGPNPDPAASLPPVPAAVRDLLGTTRPPPPEVGSDPAFRAAYYAGSRLFVTYLIERGGIATFLQLYDAPDPEAAFPSLYGETRENLTALALQ
jgi:hypothetical protein